MDPSVDIDADADAANQRTLFQMFQDPSLQAMRVLLRVHQTLKVKLGALCHSPTSAYPAADERFFAGFENGENCQ